MAEKTNSGEKKLYRSGANRMIGGVCAGVADYFNVDVTLVRIIWVITALFKGLGAIAYLACLILVPENPQQKDLPESEKRLPQNAGLIIGIVLVVIGLVFLARENYFWPYDWHFLGFWPFAFGAYWPLLLILFGVIYIFHVLKKDKEKKEEKEASETQKPKKLYRSISDRMVSGVCSGLAKYWQIDIAIIRVGWAIATLLTGIWLGIVAYIVMIFAVQEEKLSTSTEPAPVQSKTTRTKSSKSTKETKKEKKEIAKSEKSE